MRTHLSSNSHKTPCYIHPADLKDQEWEKKKRNKINKFQTTNKNVTEKKNMIMSDPVRAPSLSLSHQFTSTFNTSLHHELEEIFFKKRKLNRCDGNNYPKRQFVCVVTPCWIKLAKMDACESST